MPYAEIDNSVTPPMIIVRTEWNEKTLISSIPGSSWRDHVWRVPLTWSACLQLRGVFCERLSVSPELSAWAWKVRQQLITPAMELRDQLTADQEPDDKLFPFQRSAVNFMRIGHHGVLGDEMGTGKTITTIGYLQSLGNDAYPTLIVCPNSLKYHWANRLKEWRTPATPIIYDSLTAKRTGVLDSIESAINPIIIINYESLRSVSRLAPYANTRLVRCVRCDKSGGDPDVTPAKCQMHPKALNDVQFRTVIMDEIHRLKDPKSQQTRACWAICHQPTVRHVWGLTGTPIANSVKDLWSAMHAISPRNYPVRGKFLDRYGLKDWNSYGGVTIVGLNPATSDEFYSVFNPQFRRVTKDLVLQQLPPKVHTVHYVDMQITQKKMYAQLEKSLMCRTPDGKLLITSNQISAQTRLSQLACSSIKITAQDDPDDPTTWTVELREPSSKIDELIDIVRELGTRQAVVAAEHSKLIDLASKRLTEEGISHLKITGDVAPIDRDRALKALNDGHIQLLLFTAKAGGVGLDMSAASCLIWLQHPWSMVDYLQAEDRVRRIGSERHSQIDIVHIVTRGTIEEDRLERLQDKLNRLEEITQDKKRMRDAGLSTDALDAEYNRTATTFLGGMY